MSVHVQGLVVAELERTFSMNGMEVPSPLAIMAEDQTVIFETHLKTKEFGGQFKYLIARDGINTGDSSDLKRCFACQYIGNDRLINH